jgi:hypothetical protein
MSNRQGAYFGAYAKTTEDLWEKLENNSSLEGKFTVIGEYDESACYFTISDCFHCKADQWGIVTYDDLRNINQNLIDSEIQKLKTFVETHLKIKAEYCFGFINDSEF